MAVLVRKYPRLSALFQMPRSVFRDVGLVLMWLGAKEGPGLLNSFTLKKKNKEAYKPARFTTCFPPDRAEL